MAGWYKAGTIEVTNGSTVVAGNQTQFINNVRDGYFLVGPDERVYEIERTRSDEQLLLASPYKGVTAAGQEYAIAPTQSVIADLAAGVVDLVDTFGPLRTALPDVILYAQQTLESKNAAVAGANTAGTAAAAALISQSAAAASATSASQQALTAIAQAANASASATSAERSAAAAASGVAPLAGFRNKLINGDMRIDQRNKGAPQTITPGGGYQYTVDRWWAISAGANVTGQQVFNTGVTPNQYNYQFTGAAGVTGISFAQRIESQNSYKFCGSQMVLSADLADSNLTIVNWAINYANAVDNFSTITPIASGSFTVSPTVTRYSTPPITIPQAASTGVQVVFSVGAKTSGTLTIGAVQFEPGTISTLPEDRHLQQEQVLAYRYYRRWGMAAGVAYNCGGGVQSVVVQFPNTVPFRVAPSTATNMVAGNFVAGYPNATQWALVAPGVAYVTNASAAAVTAAATAETQSLLIYYSPGLSIMPGQLSMGASMYIESSAEL